MNRISTIAKGAVALVIVFYGLYVAFKWTVMRVYVPPGYALVVINKFGQPLPSDKVVIPPSDNDRYKGVREEMLGPGRYFFNPISYDTRLVEMVKVSAGDPGNLNWDLEGKLKVADAAPRMLMLSSKQGNNPPAGQQIAGPGEKGVQRDMLPPGTYALNPFLYDWKELPAVVVPPGSVGVVTVLNGDAGNAPTVQLMAYNPATRPAPGSPLAGPTSQSRILKRVLQPGVYYINPLLYKVDAIYIGFDVLSLHAPAGGVKIYTADGYAIEVDVTVVYGVQPQNAPEVIANIGSFDQVRDHIIDPAMKFACQTIGAQYSAKALIQGATREEFQNKLSAFLEERVEARKVDVKLALVRDIKVTDTSTGTSDGLLTTIQRANIEIERKLTTEEKTKTAKVAAELETARKEVDIARETVAAQTKVLVAQLLAEGDKKGQEVKASMSHEMAGKELLVAQSDARRTQSLGKAEADVERMKREAEARGAKLMIDAFGTPQAYNMYTFAKNWEPQDIRLIFSGQGTFWTDLKYFEQLGTTKVIQEEQAPKKR